MKILKALFVLTYIKCALSNSTTPSGLDEDAQKYSEGTSIETKYSSPPVNVSVSGSKSTHTVKSSLARVLDFYNTELLAANWDRFKGSLSPGCQKDVDAYILGLDKAENWALRMDDASGRYSTGWFWGNIYWTGSQSLCQHITPNKHIVIDSQNHSRPSREVKVSLKPSSPNELRGYSSGSMVYSTEPPFPVSFFVLRLYLNSSFTAEERILHVGLCLPYSCTNKDVQNIIQETSKSSATVTIKVEAVKSEHNKYNMWIDKTFLILCVASSVVFVLLIIGTSFDFYLEHLRNRQIKAKNAHFSTKLEVSVHDMKTKNGKCGLYVVNNNNNNNNNESAHQQ